MKKKWRHDNRKRPMQAHQKVNPFTKLCATDSFRIHPAQFIAFFTCFHPIKPLPRREHHHYVSSHRSHPIARHHHSKANKKNGFFIRLLHIYPTANCVNSIILSHALIYCDGAFARTHVTFNANDIFVWLQNWEHNRRRCRDKRWKTIHLCERRERTRHIWTCVMCRVNKNTSCIAPIAFGAQNECIEKEKKGKKHTMTMVFNLFFLSPFSLSLTRSYCTIIHTYHSSIKV